MEYIVKGIEEALGIGLKADIAPVQGFLELLVLGVEGVLAVGAQGISLQEERMSRIADNIIVGVLAALHHNILGRQAAVILPQMEIGGNIPWVADFLQGQHIRPEGINETLAGLFQKLPQCQAGIQKHIFLFLLAQLVVMLRIVIVSEHIVRHSLNVQPRLLVRHRNPLSQLHKVVAVHVFLYHLVALLGAGHRQQRLVLVGRKNTIQVLHNHGKAGIVVAFLLWQHQMQRLGRMNRHLAFDRTNSTHINTPPIHTNTIKLLSTIE